MGLRSIQTHKFLEDSPGFRYPRGLNVDLRQELESVTVRHPGKIQSQFQFVTVTLFFCFR